MFRSYDFFSERKALIGGVEAVYRVTGLAALEELLENIRETVFPCIAVDDGGDGKIDISTGTFDQSYHTIHVLVQVDERGADSAMRNDALDAAWDIGKNAIKILRGESHEPGQVAYGFDCSNINYSRIRRVGMNCYGYTFNFIMNKEYE